MQLFKKKLIFMLSIFISVASLGGCSAEPSDSNIDKSIKEYFKNKEQLLKQAGVSFNLAPKNVKKIGCVLAESEAGYICDIELNYEAAKFIDKYRFVENDDGWVVIGKVE